MDEIFLSAVVGNSQRLDGGAMFGNAPKALWSRYFSPDAENRISLACRALLVEVGDRKILLETGIGVFFAKELRSRFGVVEEEHVLLASLAQLGLDPNDITDVILSHLHFDHAGGLLAPYVEGQPPSLLFSRARYVVSQGALARAEKPHVRDRASFIAELPGLLRASGRLHVLPDGTTHDLTLPGLRFHYSSGHTPGLLLTEVCGPSPDRAVVFAGDLVPGTAWVHLPMTMGYDRFPELLIDEKTALLSDLCQRGAYLFYTHDPKVAMSKLRRGDGGRLQADASEEHPVRRRL
ncbi:MAG: MBL fold metallo-hydrolase [Myxococcales bacterium]|nr:MBL fold metallo-hydrolase [Myxococcales bacterium]